MSTQQEPASGSALEDKKKVFRLTGPIVLWWAWVVFAVVNLADLAIQGHDVTSVQIAFGLAAVTGVVYVCAFRPRVITDADGLTMLNPVREYRVPWPRVSEVYLGESSGQGQGTAQLGAVLAAPVPAEGGGPWPPDGPGPGQQAGELYADAGRGAGSGEAASR